MAQQEKTLHKQATGSRRLNYLLHLPQGYEGDAARQWPLILFLHGVGERGNNPSLVKKHGVAKVVERDPDFPFVTVSPQCPPGSWWVHHTDDLLALLDEVVGTYRVDQQRIYLTGLSMGAFGGWQLLTEAPERFAAAILICGGNTSSVELPARARRVKDVPIWIFHGDADDVVPIEASQQIVDALKAEGSRVRFTVYRGVGHDSWTRTYDNPEIYDWLLKHKVP